MKDVYTQKITAQVCSNGTWRDTIRTCTNINLEQNLPKLWPVYYQLD